MDAVTVSQLNKYMKEIVANDYNLKNITLKGEVSNFVNHLKTGHYYFTLKDESSSIKAIMFKTNASKVKFKVQNGMNVIVRGSLQVFERDGVYQFYCDFLDPDGVGALYLAFEQLKQKLAEKGLFNPEHKKSLPPMPSKIGVVTSKTGAALQDIINILSRRYPLATVVLIPVLVQGENAKTSIAQGIKKAQLQGDIDVLIIGRGGGSIEDLWAFNEEVVANAIYNCTIPTISAVGHEIDFTIADFVADLRAPTPSAAAELVAPDIAELSRNVDALQIMLKRNIASFISSRNDVLKVRYQRLINCAPNKKIANCESDLQIKKQRLELAIEHIAANANERFKKNVSMLEALSPLKVLTRGYSITYKNEAVLTSSQNLQVFDELKTRLGDGEVISVVTKIR